MDDHSASFAITQSRRYEERCRPQETIGFWFM